MEQVYTIDTAPLNGFHRKVIRSTLLGYLYVGYILGSIQFAMVSIVSDLSLNATWQGLIGATALIGLFFGSFTFGKLSDELGRKKLLQFSSAATAIIAACQIFINTAVLLFVLRLLLGFLLGAEYSACPAYATEVLPAAKRGNVLATLNFAWCGGYVAANFIGYGLSMADSGSWRWMLASSAIFSLATFISRLGLPESPRWLAMNGKIDESVKVIHTYIGENISVENLVERSEEENVDRSIKALFSKNMWRKTTFICIAFISVLLPIYGIMTFIPSVVASLGIENEAFSSLMIDLGMVVGSVFTGPAIRMSSRKKATEVTLFLSGLPLILVAVFTSMPPMLVVICFIAQTFFCAICSGMISFVFPSETFPTEIRTTGNGFCTACSRIGAVCGSFFLPSAITAFGTAPVLLVIGIIQFIALGVTIAWAPDNRGEAVN